MIFHITVGWWKEGKIYTKHTYSYNTHVFIYWTNDKGGKHISNDKIISIKLTEKSISGDIIENVFVARKEFSRDLRDQINALLDFSAKINHTLHLQSEFANVTQVYILLITVCYIPHKLCSTFHCNSFPLIWLHYPNYPWIPVISCQFS